ncbi:hypothetical protein [Tessaracoccus palaemonis]|uniref:Uncharacterized protein n=1 Tax=Tessaracoccus palaemonis TaxID=2829499 RepID=A0ABX8SH70_9ACTN|nr:hypothetical protein [Tessaracoccus palaemonis]QXT62737.1 hypothetical protein KDB89_13540 [Tessaracoccus palaemonis]
MTIDKQILTPLPGQHVSIAPGEGVFPEIMNKINGAISNHPRSLQKRIGPSEIGHPCARKLAYKLLGQPERTDLPPNWKATVGTAVHGWMEDVFDADNLATAHLLDGQERWYIESRVSVGEVGGVEITGSSDLFDRVTLSNWDWKVVGPYQLDKYKRQGPSEVYRAQAHLYGRGWWRAGIGCASVNIVFLARNGDLSDTYHWSEPYNEQVALDALQRLEGINSAVTAFGPTALDVLPTADSYCTNCEFYKFHSTNLAEGCPGDPKAAARQDASRTNQLGGLIPAGK